MLSDWNIVANDDGSVTFTPKEEDIRAAASMPDPYLVNTRTISTTTNFSNVSVGTVYTGTCTFSADSTTVYTDSSGDKHGYGGDAIVSAFTGNNLFTQIVGNKTLYASCERWWEWDSDPSNSAHAYAIAYGSGIYYRAKVTAKTDTSITFEIRYSDNNNYNERRWSTATTEVEWRIARNYTVTQNPGNPPSISGTMLIQTRANVRGNGWSDWETQNSISLVAVIPSGAVQNSILTTVSRYIRDLNVTGEDGNKGPVTTRSHDNVDGNGNTFTNYETWSPDSNYISVFVGPNAYSTGTHSGYQKGATGAITISYQHVSSNPSIYQIYRGVVRAEAEVGSLQIIKSVSPAPTSARTFYFYITGPNSYTNSTSITIGAGSTSGYVVIENLTPGNYVVTEVTTEGGTTPVTSAHDWAYSSSSDKANNTVTVSAGNQATITWTNSENLKLPITKSVNSSCTAIVNGNSYYTLNGTQIGVYENQACTTLAKTKDGNNAIITISATDGQTTSISNTLIFDYDEYAGVPLYVKEIKSGRGYTLNTTPVRVTMPTTAGGTATAVNIVNTTIADPLSMRFTKVSSKTGQNFSGTISAQGARYTLEYYPLTGTTNLNNPSSVSHASSPSRTWTFQVDSNNTIRFDDASYKVSGSDLFVDPSDTSQVAYPSGYYTLKETSAPNGLEIDPTLFELYYLPDTADGTNMSYLNRYIYVSGSTISGYANRTRVYARENGTVTIDANYKIGNVPLLSGDSWKAAEPEEWATMRIQKVDNVTGTTPQGDLSLGGAVFRLYCTNAVNLDGSDFTKGTTGITTLQTADGKTVSFGTTVYPVLLNGSQYTITTNASGLATTGTRLLPYSANGYYLVEYSAPAGYYTDGVAHNVTNWTSTTSGGTTTYTAQASDAKETPRTYPIEGWKNDAVTGSTPQGNASLNGIRFAVINTSANPVVVGGTTIGVNRVVGIMTTTTNNGRQGYFSMSGLPVGKYQIVELRVGATAPVNGTVTQGTNTMANDYYLFSANTINVTIASNGTVTYSPTNATVTDTPKSIGISITKTDTEGNSVSTLSLAGIRYAIVNRGTNAVRVNNTNYNSGVVVAILTINASGTASITGLPYSDYDVYELRSNATITVGTTFDATAQANGGGVYGNSDSVKANNTYLWTNTVRNVRPTTSTAHNASFTVTYSNPPIRADFSFIKYGGTTSTRLAYIPFLVTNTDTGEKHVIITDANGLINTKTRTRTASSMNRLDSNYSGTTYTGEMNATAAGYNIWFGSTDGIAANRGVLIPGHYTVEELRCTRNQGYALITFDFTFSPTASGAQLVNNGDLYEADSGITINPEMSFTTNVVDGGTGTKELTVGSAVTIRDTISAVNLMRSRTYSYTTEVVVTDFNGNYKRTIQAESAKTNFPSGSTEFYNTTVTATLTVNTSSVVAGEKVCIVTRIYESGYAPVLITHNENYLDANEWLYNIDYPIQITKSIPSKYNSIVSGNPNYSLNGVTFYVYTDANCTTRAVDKSGNPISIVLTGDAGSMNSITSNKVILNKYHGQKLYAKEVVSGNGFKLSTDVKEVTVPTQANLTANTLLTFTFDNDPMYDVPSILQKVSDKSGSSDFDGNVLVANAEYTVTFRYEENSSVIRTWVYKTDSNGKIDFSKDTNKVSGTTYKDPNDNTTNVWPLGYYTITETKTAENASGNKTGVALDTATYVVRLYKAADNQHVNRTVTKNGTTVFHRTYASNGTVTNTSSATINGTNTPLYISNSETLNSIETEVWAPIGVLKADNWYWTQNSADNILKLPEGNASYEGAQYLVLVDASISNADRDSFFVTTRSNPNGTKVLTFDTAISSIDVTDGIGTVSTTNLNGNYYPVLVDGQRLIITTNANGYGESSVKLPYSGMYRLVEIKAPEGYNVDRTVRSISNVWYDSDVNLLGVNDYDGTHHDVVIVPGTATSRAGAVPDEVLKYNLAGYKMDADYTDAHIASGDGSLNGIRYAVVNRSDNSIVVTSVSSTTYINTQLNRRFAKGEVVAILTTHTFRGEEGYFNMENLPYGTYDVYELRMDSTIAVGDVYDSVTSKYGTSIYANEYYLYTDNHTYATVDKTNANYSNFTVAKKTYVLDGNTHSGVTYNATNKIYTMTSAFANYPVRGSVSVQKKDLETGLAQNQGINTFEGIRYAIVNRSALPVSVYDDSLGRTMRMDTNWVVAILTLDENGYALFDNLPYGTYDIYELREDAKIIDILYKDWTTLTSTQLGTSPYVNDYYLYSDSMGKVVNVTNPDYSVDPQNIANNTNHFWIEFGDRIDMTFLNPTKRGDLLDRKYDQNGHKMSYVPFAIQLVETDDSGNIIRDADGNPHIIEQHILLTDGSGILTTDSKNRTYGRTKENGVNLLDNMVNVNGALEYTGACDDSAVGNIWFGDQTYIDDARGACLPGTYIIQELRAPSNAGYTLASDIFVVTEDNEVVFTEDALVDLEITIVSQAYDVHSKSDVLTKGTNVTLRDTVTFQNLKYRDIYGYVTKVQVTDDNGNIINDNFYTTPIKTLDLGTPAAGEDPETKLRFVDVQEMTVNTNTLEVGMNLNFTVLLYQKINGHWTEDPIAVHNTSANVDSQMLVIPDMSTVAVNKTTGSRLASMDGKTVADDKLTYKNLGNDRTWTILAKLVDKNGNTVKDVNGNLCQVAPISFYTSREITNVRVLGTYNISGQTMKSVEGPTTGEFSFSDLGLMDFVLPNDTYESVYFVVSIVNPANGEELLSHNADLDVEDEIIRYMQISTVASSSDYLQGVLPNSTSATLKDTISYTNLVENTAVKIVGKVFEVKETNGVKSVDLNNPIVTNTLNTNLTKGSGTREMAFTFDTTPYAGKDLVVYEWVYTTIGGEDILISAETDVNNEDQTVSIPKITTKNLVNLGGTRYKVVSRVNESVVIEDTVTYTNLSTKYNWSFIGTLMNKATQQPVKDKNGNNVTTTVNFKPTSKNGTRVVTFSFDQNVVDIEWEDIEVWVAFETVKANESGHTDLVYAEHNDYNDEDQTVYVPSLRTTAKSNNTNHPKQIVGKPNQVVTDTIEYNNFVKNLNDGDTFVLKMEAIDKDTNDVLQTVTKSITWNGQSTDTMTMTLDGTNLIGKTIIFKETVYYGTTATTGHELLVENAEAHVEEWITVPKMTTTALDSETNSETVSLERKIVDTIELERILPDTDFVITTKVWDKKENAFLKNNDGTDFVMTTNYHSPATNASALVCEHCGKVYAIDDTVTITIDLSGIDNLDGKVLVVYEDMPYKNEYYVDHQNPNDVNQTVKVPGIHTLFTDDTTETHVTVYGDTVEITDTITYENLIPNTVYTMTCTLMDKNADAVFTVNGAEQIRTETFTSSDTGNGTTTVKFTIDTTSIEGKRLVAYETCKVNGVAIAEHNDLLDEDQTVRIPVIQTELLDIVVDDHMTAYNTTEVVEDTVTYANLQEGLTYKMVGTLYNKETQELLATTEQVFVAETDGFGTVKLQLTVDSVALKGHKVVAFEDCYYKDTMLVGTHSNLDDENQTVEIPDIATIIVDPITELPMTHYGETVVVRDKVSYTNLLPLKEYTFEGILMDIVTREPVLDKNGNKITATKKFTPTEHSGFEYVEFTIDTDFLKGKVLVAFEECKLGDIVVARHHDFDDEDQTLYIPNVETKFFDTIYNDEDENVGRGVADTEKIKLVDNVYYENVLVDKEYTIVGTIYDKNTNDVFVDKDGNTYTSEVTFTADATSGMVQIEFEVDVASLEGETLVAFETLKYKDIEIAVHADINDEDETIYIPKVRTTLVDTITEEHVAGFESVTLIDYVAYENLVIGKEYTINGQLLNRETEEVLATNSITFIADAVDGTKEIVFTLTDKSILHSITVVATEELVYKDVIVAEHKDLDDLNQTVDYPNIHTTLKDKSTEEHIAPKAETITLVDTVTYDHLTVGLEYTLVGVLMDKETEKAIVDKDGNKITESVVFVPTEKEGTVEVEFTFDSTLLGGKTLVAFETLYFDEKEVAIHTNIEDEEQTVYIPDINTTFYDVAYDKDEDIVSLGETVTVRDIVEYTNLVPNLEYTIIGTIINKADGKALEGVEPVEVTFTPDTANGTVEVDFEIDSTKLPNTTLVAYATLKLADVDLVVHNDIDDVAETVRIAEIHTTATDKTTEEHIGVIGSEVTIIDTVEYYNLVPDKEYTVIGTLMLKGTNEPLKDKNDNPITKTVKFTVEKPDGYVDGDGVDGSVEVPFIIDSTLLKGETVVVFETVYYKDIEVAIHNDIEDEEQSVHYPEIHTLFVSTDTEDHIVPVGETTKLIDTVYYDNLIVGLEYVMTGKLVNKENGEVFKNEDGDEIVSTVTFTPMTSTGTVNVEFEIDTTIITDTTQVCFEVLTYNDIVVVTHEDIEDEQQTVYIPEIHTTARDKEDDDQILDGTKTEQTIVDTVEVKNLVVGKEYTLTGKLAIKKDYAEGEDIEFVLDEDGNILTSTVTFVAEEADGTIEVEFTFDASKYAGYKIVVFESIYFNGVEIATHADIEDENQTVEISLFLHVKIAKVDHDNIKYVLRGAEITIFDENGDVVLDIDGIECVGVTDENGEVNFTILWDRNKKYFAKETKAPEGFNICDDLFEVVPTDDRESDGVCLIPLQIRDRRIVIPPKTGDETPIGILLVLLILGMLCVGAFFVIKSSPKTTSDEEEEDVEDDTEEDEDELISLLIDDIDGNPIDIKSPNDSG